MKLNLNKLEKLILIYISAFAIAAFYAIGVSHIVEGRFWDGVITFAVTKLLVVNVYLASKGDF